MRCISTIRPLRLFFALLLVAVMATAAGAATWQIDPDHSAAHFSIRHLMIAQVRGMVPDVHGTVTFENGRPTAFNIAIGVDSLETGVPKRDAHLKSDDFFAVARYPEMTFTSTKVEPAGKGYRVTGTLTIKDVSREVTATLSGLDADKTDPWKNTRRGGKAVFTLDRTDYGIDWNVPMDGGGFMIGNEVPVIVDVEIIKPKE